MDKPINQGDGITTSVALCTYNGEKYILEQLTSIVCQTVLPNEVVICDDNSLDDTINLINWFMKRYHDCGIDFKLITNSSKSKGVAKNFENAIKHTTGEIIFLCIQVFVHRLNVPFRLI